MLTMNTASLRAALTLCKGVIAARVSIPILSNVRITAAGDRITVTATDMEACYVLPVEGVGEPLDVTVPHKQLAGLVASYKGATVTMATAEGNRVAVQIGGMTSHLPTLPTDDFPLVEAGALPNSMTLAAPVLREAFGVPQHAISTEKTRYYLNGVCWDMESSTVIRTVAADGHRLAMKRTPKPCEATGQIIVPANGVTCLLAFCGKSANAMTVEWSKSRFRVTRPDGGTFTTKTIDGTFPEYSRVIPRDHAHIVTAPAVALSEMVKRVSSVSSERSKTVKLTFGGDAIEVFAHSAETGSATERLNGGAVRTPTVSFEIGFRARYLRDMLAWCGDTVEGKFGGMSDPAVFHPAGDDSRLFVLMPIRV